MVRFRLRRKTNHIPSLLRERSARKTSVFNQKAMFLGYAHSSVIFTILQSYQLLYIILKPYIKSKRCFSRSPEYLRARAKAYFYAF
ncbi:MAG: hypothetical protein U5L45_25720 [Saprospiraceae bacterium]|nr:hypothetical protein [Saprospiraceae bacterium]